jgi:hypothetical protein
MAVGSASRPGAKYVGQGGEIFLPPPQLLLGLLLVINIGAGTKPGGNAASASRCGRRRPENQR